MICTFFYQKEMIMLRLARKERSEMISHLWPTLSNTQLHCFTVYNEGA